MRKRTLVRNREPGALKVTVVDLIFVDDNGGVHYVEAKHSLPRIQLRFGGDFEVPAAVQFALMLMSRQRRNDVLNDMMDWYPLGIVGKDRLWVNLLCWWRIGLAVFGGFLDLAAKIAEVVGKFRGAK